MNKIEYQAHHDGHGLADIQLVWADERDAENGNASHAYQIRMAGVGTVADVQFQHGPRDEEGSQGGVIDGALLAIVLDRYAGFQSGPFRSRENAVVITKLEEALMWMKKRADDRARRGVLGKNIK